MTPQLRGASGAFKRDVDMDMALHRPSATSMATDTFDNPDTATMDPTQSLALICSPTSSTRPEQPQASSWAHGTPEGATPISEFIRRHSAGEPLRSTRLSSVDMSQWSTDDSWTEAEDKGVADGVADIANEAVASDIESVVAAQSKLGAKREYGSTASTQSSKRRRLDLGFIVEPGFCLKTAILLGKMYALQGMVPASEQQRVALQWITALTLVISAADIHNRSLGLSLVLLGANVVLFCVYMSFKS
ncbi:hypothetical protein FBU31_005562 [Coemansia sp. 'formosensis']|nr:hypothetical protein FBU31_005562 [Coemansia sp. 'formosensis']